MNMQFLGFLLQGLAGTVILSALTFFFGGIVGFIVSLARISPLRVVSLAAGLYTQCIQGIPLLVLMGVCYFGPSLVGFESLPPLVAATLAMTIFASSYLGEIWYGCLLSVPKAQWEAAECIGLSRWQRMTRVILPQAIRIATPPTVGFLVIIVKNTSVSSLVVGYTELSYNAKVINNSAFEPFLYFGLAGLLYFLICYPLSLKSRALEKKLNVANR
ncbi:amino acid ABC transporter permease [Agrobacterium rhizogenes]|uniref:amino acid ABC transporter permease n=1 Tax=Rhizobium rhizogenes TaxID=359 RepID=UPI001572A311|nr:amino acid ABC transporter permease [Rhizobium rhizogenes]NTH16595.1 amino acid ABC transporter permease [Rhizobium rhizogenes]